MWRVLIFSVVLAILAAFFLRDGAPAFTQKGGKPQLAKLAGTVEFSGVAQFGADTVARVTLQDVSLADAPAKTLGEQVITGPKQFPVAFEVAYDPDAIQSRHRYAVQVRIETQGRLDYVNDTAILVITDGWPTQGVQVPVIRVSP